MLEVMVNSLYEDKEIWLHDGNDEDWNGLWLNCVELEKNMKNNLEKVELAWKMNIMTA